MFPLRTWFVCLTFSLTPPREQSMEVKTYVQNRAVDSEFSHPKQASDFFLTLPRITDHSWPSWDGFQEPSPEEVAQLYSDSEHPTTSNGCHGDSRQYLSLRWAGEMMGLSAMTAGLSHSLLLKLARVLMGEGDFGRQKTQVWRSLLYFRRSQAVVRMPHILTVWTPLNSRRH